MSETPRVAHRSLVNSSTLQQEGIRASSVRVLHKAQLVLPHIRSMGQGKGFVGSMTVMANIAILMHTARFYTWQFTIAAAKPRRPKEKDVIRAVKTFCDLY